MLDIHARLGQNISSENRARQDRTGQGRTGQGRAGQGRAGQGRAGQGRAGQNIKSTERLLRELGPVKMSKGYKSISRSM